MKVETQVFPLNLNKDIHKQFLKDNKITWVYLPINGKFILCSVYCERNLKNANRNRKT